MACAFPLFYINLLGLGEFLHFVCKVKMHADIHNNPQRVERRVYTFEYPNINQL